MKQLFWFCALFALALAVVGGFLVELPATDSVDLRDVEVFYRNAYLVGIFIGLVVGITAGFRSKESVRHLVGESGGDFNGRVAKRGLMFGLLSALLAFAADVVLAAWLPMGPMGAVERVRLITRSLFLLQSPALALGTSMIGFAVVTRFRRWGGRYSLISKTFARLRS